MLPLLHVKPNDRVLDLGCGAGRWAEVIVPHTERYLGVDFSVPLLEVARRRFPGTDFQIMNVAQFDPDKLMTPPPFTLVICSGVMTYVNDSDLGALLAQLSRVMTERSRLYLREPMAKDRRLALDSHWSDELQADYSAIYRTRSEYLELLHSLEGFRVQAEGESFPRELQNRAETEQRYILLER
jgi:cyclopropane fatty-acyl-phospholipid synthase-like methyltransferase